MPIHLSYLHVPCCLATPPVQAALWASYGAQDRAAVRKALALKARAALLLQELVELRGQVGRAGAGGMRGVGGGWGGLRGWLGAGCNDVWPLGWCCTCKAPEARLSPALCRFGRQLVPRMRLGCRSSG